MSNISSHNKSEGRQADVQDLKVSSFDKQPLFVEYESGMLKFFQDIVLGME